MLMFPGTHLLDWEQIHPFEKDRIIRYVNGIRKAEDYQRKTS